MSDYPTTHVRTRKETLDEVKAFVIRELAAYLKYSRKSSQN